MTAEINLIPAVTLIPLIDNEKWKNYSHDNHSFLFFVHLVYGSILEKG